LRTARAGLFTGLYWKCYKAAMNPSADMHSDYERPTRGRRPRVRSTLDFASLDDHARMPARFFGRLVAASAAHLGRI
jgi:hypothetical protein